MAKSRQPTAPEELAIPLWLWWPAVGVTAVLLIVTFEFGYAVGEKRAKAKAEATEVAALAKPSTETPSVPKTTPKPPVAAPVPVKVLPPTTPKAEPEPPIVPKAKEPSVEVISPKVEPAKPPVPPEPVLVAKPTFVANILPVFQTKCVSCHGGLSKKAGLDVRTLEALVRGGKNGTVLKPGKLEQSSLWASVESGEMPPSNKPQLTADEKKMIRDWINSGAK
ncbi:MAG: hypothetical protein K8U57_30825 [Planctomycetes bacterium]|nr:hypothetical protein [Planctomycetota bacterium]